jgi:YidC/Oxa1 family membrane protein insertase
MENNRNFFITIALSVLILTLWQVFYMNPRVETQREAARIEAERVAEQQKAAQPAGTTPGAGTPAAPQAGIPGAPTTQVAVADRAQAIAASGRIALDTPSLKGSINLTGARIDDISLKHYRVAVEPNSPVIELLNPQALPAGFYGEIGFVGSEATGSVPGPDTVWTAESNATLTPATPVTLTYTNDKGLTFKRTIAVDQNYMFTVTDTVTNAGAADVALSNYGRLTRFDKPLHASTYVLHEGLIGVTGTEGLQEIKYSTIEGDKQVLPGKSTDGWLGITDKYWAASLIPSGKQPFQPRFSYFEDGRPRYQADYLTDPITVAAGQSATVETLVFAGAKEVAKINAYEKDRQIRQFDLLIDWGWFYFITKPMFWLIDTLYKFLGNFGLAILATSPSSSRPSSSRSPTSPTSMAKMKGAAQDAGDPRALCRRQDEAAAGDDGAVQDREDQPARRLLAGADADPGVLRALQGALHHHRDAARAVLRLDPRSGGARSDVAVQPVRPAALGRAAFLMIGVWPMIMGVTMFLQMKMNPSRRIRPRR